MSQTDVERSTRLSGTLFDEVLLPLAGARKAVSAAPYFPKWRDAQASTYFEPSDITSMAAADFEFPGGGTPEGLIEALATYWLAQGDTALAASAPQLRAIAAALRDESVDDDGSVDIFCYTLF